MTTRRRLKNCDGVVVGSEHRDHFATGGGYAEQLVGRRRRNPQTAAGAQVPASASAGRQLRTVRAEGHRIGHIAAAGHWQNLLARSGFPQQGLSSKAACGYSLSVVAEPRKDPTSSLGENTRVGNVQGRQLAAGSEVPQLNGVPFGKRQQATVTAEFDQTVILSGGRQGTLSLLRGDVPDLQLLFYDAGSEQMTVRGKAKLEAVDLIVRQAHGTRLTSRG